MAELIRRAAFFLLTARSNVTSLLERVTIVRRGTCSIEEAIAFTPLAAVETSGTSPSLNREACPRTSTTTTSELPVEISTSTSSSSLFSILQARSRCLVNPSCAKSTRAVLLILFLLVNLRTLSPFLNSSTRNAFTIFSFDFLVTRLFKCFPSSFHFPSGRRWIGSLP